MPRTRNSCPASVSFGRRARELREEREWTLDQLADQSGVSRSVVLTIEQGDNTTLDTAAKIAKALGVPLAVMLSPETCATCHGAPYRGFICGECGTAGAGVTR